MNFITSIIGQIIRNVKLYELGYSALMNSQSGKEDEYRIRNHGVIGDTYSAALVTTRGTIDWCAFPRFDSSPVFFSLLDKEKGGELRIDLAGASSFSQSYLKLTNVLKTTISSPECRIEVDDFMPVEEVDGVTYSRHEIHRIIRCTKGKGMVGLKLKPRFGFGRDSVSLSKDKYGCLAAGDGHAMTFSVPARVEIEGDCAMTSFSLRKGDIKPAVVRWDERKTLRPSMEYSGRMLKETVSYWRRWVSKTPYEGPWKEEVLRSALVLKLLSYSPSGAICAAATTSLPESIGNGRNWDYRFSWIRDSTYALLSFNALGHEEEEMKYFMWLVHLLRGHASNPEKLRVMYSVEGDPVPDERILTNLSGYMNSGPVREGNGATGQVQLDIYGSVADAIYSTFKPPEKIPDMMWRIVDSTAMYLERNWKRKDMGIWEMRNGTERHTHSAVMSWVAFSRAAEMAKWLGYRGRMRRYKEAASEVKEDVMKHSYDSTAGAFVSGLDGGYMDASVLLMPLRGFIDAGDRKFKSTLRAVRKHLMRNGFVFRYRGSDGLSGEEGAFIICTFWYIASTARAGNVEEATAMLEHVLSHSNHLGLFSEEIDPDTGEFLGNFPQAFSHMGLIQAAMELSRVLKAGKAGARQLYR